MLTFVYPLCSIAYFENHECLFLLFPSVNFLTACQALETTVLCYCKCITNEKHIYIFGKSAVFSTRSDFFWRFTLGVWWKSQKKKSQYKTALIKVTSFFLNLKIPMNHIASLEWSCLTYSTTWADSIQELLHMLLSLYCFKDHVYRLRYPCTSSQNRSLNSVSIMFSSVCSCALTK